MNTNTLPFAEITADQIGTRDIARKNSTLGEQVIKIELSKISIRDGFNVRQDYGDLDSLALSILENGQTIPGKVDVLADGTFLLTDGHRRFKALQMLVEMGHDNPMFKATVNSTRISEEERIIQMFTTQDNKPLMPHEIAELIRRLVNLGYNQITVAKKIGKTPGYISQMMAYATESIVIKEHVTNGHLNVSTALKLQKEIPVQSERVAAVNKAVNAKKETVKDSSDKDKKVAPVTVKEVTGKEEKKISKPEELANEILQMFEMDDTFKTQLVSLIKSYL